MRPSPCAVQASRCDRGLAAGPQRLRRTAPLLLAASAAAAGAAAAARAGALGAAGGCVAASASRSPAAGVPAAPGRQLGRQLWPVASRSGHVAPARATGTAAGGSPAAGCTEAGLSELRTVPGQKVAYLLSENDMLVDDAIERELEALAAQEAERRGSGSAAATGDAAMLQERIDGVRREERSRAVSELMYLSLLRRFRALGAPLSPTLRQGGYVNFKETRPAALTTDIHSQEAMEMLRNVLARTVISTTGMSWDMNSSQAVQIPLVAAGQLYATTALFGHFLRRVDSKFRLERSLGSLVSSGVAERAGVRALEEYAQSFDPSQIREMGQIAHLESQVALELQVRGIFGDLRDLRDKLIAACGQTDILAPSSDFDRRLRAAIDSGKVPVLRFPGGDLRRLLLEAVAFGGFLGDLGSEFEGLYSLTPSTNPRLDSFGFDNEGGVATMPWLSR